MAPQAAERDKADDPHGFQGALRIESPPRSRHSKPGSGRITNDRSLNLETFEGVEASMLDLYAAVRNAYGQKHAKAV
ncbi:MAG: hypothetical protein LKG23_08665 [Nitrospira sp.]|nr:hypothetical protein [Nitrospira sp.]